MVRGAARVIALVALVGCAPEKPGAAPVSVVVGPQGGMRAVEAVKEPEVALTPKGKSDEPMVLPCTRESVEGKAALAQLAAIDAKVRALPANATTAATALMKEIHLVLEGPCFQLALQPYPIESDSGLSLKEFWDAGAAGWLDNQLSMDDPVHRTFLVAPSTLRTLASDVNKTSPLLPLLCPADAALPGSTSACGRETLGWLHRAQQSYARADEAARAHGRDAPDAPPPASAERCAAAAKTEDEKDAFYKYAICLTEVPPHTDAPPLGRFAAPKEGWLVVRGTRGHHSYCDGVSAFDLATGAFYGVSICNGIAMLPAQPRGIQGTIGRVPVDALREAALMILLTNAGQSGVVTRGMGWSVPPTMKVWGRSPMLAGIGLGGVGWSSGRTSLEVSWVRAGVVQARSSVSWPDAYDATHAHATELLTIAEMGLTQGCAPVKLPRIPWGALGQRTESDGYAPKLDANPVYNDLQNAMETLRPRPICVPAR